MPEGFFPGCPDLSEKELVIGLSRWCAADGARAIRPVDAPALLEDGAVGTGKTHTVIQGINDSGKRTAVFTPTVALATANKARLEATDEAVRERNHAELREAAAEPARAKAFLMRTALIDGLREAEAIG